MTKGVSTEGTDGIDFIGVMYMCVEVVREDYGKETNKKEYHEKW